MAKVSIKTLKQTEKNGLFSLVFENEAYSEFEKFIEKFKNEADAIRDLNVILSYIEQMINGAGFLERYFRDPHPTAFKEGGSVQKGRCVTMYAHCLWYLVN